MSNIPKIPNIPNKIPIFQKNSKFPRSPDSQELSIQKPYNTYYHHIIFLIEFDPNVFFNIRSQLTQVVEVVNDHNTVRMSDAVLNFKSEKNGIS